jgi:hypothetical protein
LQKQKPSESHTNTVSYTECSTYFNENFLVKGNLLAFCRTKCVKILVEFLKFYKYNLIGGYMFNKLFALTVLTAATCVAANAQNAPSAPTERRVQRMAFGVPFEGSYLGVQTENISKENFSKYGLATVRGVGIDSVVKDSPAAKAGLQKGDVIVRFEGEDVSSVNKLTRLIAEVAPDHTAKMTILRDGGEREISVTLGRREMPQFQGGNFTFENMIPMTPRTPRTMQTVPLPPLGSGDSDNVFIWRGGANRQIGVGVTSLTKQLRALNEKSEGGVAITFIRDKNRQTVNVTPETVKQEKMKPEELEKLFNSNDRNSSDN